ncbi:MAG TPA: DUF1839 family protein [Holophagaceae bacterium]|nr:DUF1839 family protein [Holophagaceae bacterium]
MKSIAPLDPATYVRHAIHGEGRTWIETNCYTDVVVELLHGLGHEPLAAMAFTLAADFEGDQWTFFKFEHADLLHLYGWDIHELAPWRPLVAHIEEQVDLGRPVLVELDSFYLPDTAGTAYKLAHVKSTVAVNAIDPAREWMGYFHNQGYHALEGQDFRDVFQTEGLVHERMMPPYIEYVKFLRHFRKPSAAQQAAISVELMKDQLSRAPERNPFGPFKARLEADSEWLLSADIEVFHAYSFATFRQFGACFELAATYLQWLGSQGVEGLAEAEAAFREISTTTKAYQFQLARAMARKRPFDVTVIDGLAAAWERGMGDLRARFLP